MIYGIIVIIGILVCIGATICKACDFWRDDVWEALQGFGLCAAVIAIIIAGVVGAGSIGAADSIVVENKELLLYKEAIENSDSEYVRFDFMEKVENHNARLRRYERYSENIWLESFYPIEDLQGIKEIEFELRTGETETVLVG